tara:strand:+ start:1166 stop:1549 length:384 start_codon:yes stop_codon:yes gene_type:complete
MGLLSAAKYAVLTNLPGGVINVILYDRFGNEVANEIGDQATVLYDDAIEAGAEAIDKIGDVVVDVANAALDIIEGAGLAVISAGEKMYDYTYSKVAPHRVEAVTALTALTIYLTTAVIVFKKIRGAN